MLHHTIDSRERRFGSIIYDHTTAMDYKTSPSLLFCKIIFTNTWIQSADYEVVVSVSLFACRRRRESNSSSYSLLAYFCFSKYLFGQLYTSRDLLIVQQMIYMPLDACIHT